MCIRDRSTQSTWGIIHDMKLEVAQAITSFEKSLELLKIKCGAISAEVAWTLRYIGLLNCYQNHNKPRGLECLQESLDIYTQVAGPDHPQTQQVRADLEKQQA
eukprot:TRINITY_DN2510_c0_g1_i2.p1 TRINITY_DN2510_c0_g1~~TRINITY_DN2510_c0_g1_i2.p1  ORF type:complete len:103 (+),score=29.64 TRINITY_DN2510_c0_g1_i2:65-373(+)